MRSSSTINSSLAKKRRKNLFKKAILLCVFILFFISVTLFGITSDKLKVNNINITGNATKSEEQILTSVSNGINKKYLWFIPTDNFFLLRRSLIEEQVLSDIKKIQSVKITFKDTHTVKIFVYERQQFALWCASTLDCYSMDSTGFVYEQSQGDDITSIKYFGMISGDPIGQSYLENTIDNTASATITLSENRFKDASNFFSTLIKMNMHPESFYALTDHEYEVGLSFGGKILLNDKKTFEKSLTNLQALIDSGYIKTDEDSLKKIKYIDLRYGNKVILD